MKTCIVFLFVSLGTYTCRGERVVMVGFDASATAFQGHGNPYADGFRQVLQTVQGGDQVFAAIVNERGLGNGAPEIAFSIRPYNVFNDQRSAYNAAVRTKLDKQSVALDTLLKSASPARGTELIGYLFQASKILSAYPQATKQVVIFTDGLQEGSDVNLTHMRLSDSDIDALVATERKAGRLPALNGMAVWFITGPSLHGQISTNGLLRLEAFWTKFIEASGGKLKAFSPLLVGFGHDSR